jgi:hypothetical protein
MDRQADPVDVVTPEDELRQLVIDIEDLIDWAAAAPRRGRRQVPRPEYVVAVGVTALVVGALALLLSRSGSSR